MYDPIRDAAEEKTTKSPTNESQNAAANGESASSSTPREREKKRPAPTSEDRSPRRPSDEKQLKRPASSQEQDTSITKSPSPSAKKAKHETAPEPVPIRRSPSPPRQRKRPGQASRIDSAARDATMKRQREREAEQLAASRRVAVERGSHDVVKQHYNAVPQRGREWRRTDSKIKGLRSFNNWVKSVLIQKFSPNDDWTPGAGGQRHGGSQGILVLDIGCGKGGDLGKWQKAPQRVEAYIGIDPAEVSVDQARERYNENRARSKGRMFDALFFAKDGYGEWVGDIPEVRNIGVDREVGPGTSSRWGQAGFDVVTMMFCMHYAFESEELARGMLRNVAGALKKGGRFIGVIPDSDIIREKVESFHTKKKQEAESRADGSAPSEEDGEVQDDELKFGNELYHVRFPGETPEDGVFRPPFGWKYSFFIEEAVEAPEYIVPFEAFRALAEDYNLEMQYRKPFHEIWKDEKDDPELGALAQRMGVTRGRGSDTVLSKEEWEAVGFYQAFCFYRV